MSAPEGQLQEQLRDVAAAELARKCRKLVKIDMTTTLDEALQLMRDENILSVPVYNAFSKEWVGLLTIHDILYYVAFKDFDEDGNISDTFDNGNQAAGNLIEQTESTTFPVAGLSDTVEDLLEPLSKGFHRILVRLPIDSGQSDTAESELRIVSQTDILRCGLLFDCSAKWGMSVVELGLEKANVISMTSDETALQGFKRMATRDVSALAVVSAETGKLLTVLSSSDLRGLTSNLMMRVNMPVIQFLKETRHGRIRKAVCIAAGVTLREATHKIVFGGVHRVFVTDSDNHPIGVLSATDVITQMWNTAQERR